MNAESENEMRDTGGLGSCATLEVGEEAPNRAIPAYPRPGSYLTWGNSSTENALKLRPGSDIKEEHINYFMRPQNQIDEAQ